MNGPPAADGSRTRFIYDGDCGFCRAWVSWMRHRLRLGGDVVAWQHTDLAALGLTPDDTRREAWFADGDRISGGSAAIAAWLRTGHGLVAVAGRLLDLPLAAAAAAVVYRTVARHRHQLPAPRQRAGGLPPSGGDSPG